MLKKSEKFTSLFRSRQNVGDDVTSKSDTMNATSIKGDSSVTKRDAIRLRSSSFKSDYSRMSSTMINSIHLTSSMSNLNIASQSNCDDLNVTQCYSVTTGKVSTLVRSPSISTVSSHHSTASFNGADGDDELELFPPKILNIMTTGSIIIVQFELII